MKHDSSGASDERRCDILVCGAGYVGLATAVAIKQARPSLDVVLVDAAPEGVWRKDGRASAIAAAAEAMLTASASGRACGGRPADHRDDRHRQPHLRPDPPGVPDLLR